LKVVRTNTAKTFFSRGTSSQGQVIFVKAVYLPFSPFKKSSSRTFPVLSE